MDAELLKKERTDISVRTKANKAKSSLTREEYRIIEAVLEARDEWVAANNDFNYADDDLLVDYQVYRLKACEARYAYFLKLAKEKGLTLGLLSLS